MPDTIAASNRFWVLGQLVDVKLVTDAYSVVDITLPAGVPGPPPHIHHDAAELFYILEGELEITRGDERLTLSQSQSATIPAGTLHTFTNRTNRTVRMLTVFDPAGFEKFFMDLGVTADSPDAQRASVEPAIIGRVIAEAGKYHMEIPMTQPTGR